MTPCALTSFVLLLLLAATFEAYIMWPRLPDHFTDNPNAYKRRSVNGSGKSIKSETIHLRKKSYNSRNLVRLAGRSQNGKNVNKNALRVYQGTSVDSDDYPYVVVLTTMKKFGIDSNARVIFIRYCTGSLISQQWVLSAAHCIENPMIVKTSWVFYGRLEDINNNSKSNSKVIKGIPHHRYYRTYVEADSHERWQWALRNDIGLLLVNKIELKHLGKLSAADYKSMIGYSVTYVGAGTTNSEYKNETQKQVLNINLNDLKRPLQVGEAVVARCDRGDKAGVVASFICLRPKCSKRLQQVRGGDSGGPLLRRGKIIGICSAGVANKYVTLYTAISPYLDWLHLTMLSHSKH